MGIETATFAADGARSKKNGGWRLWRELLVHTLFQIETLQFRKLVISPGHYPLFGPLETAIEEYRTNGGTLQILLLRDTMYSDDGKAGDHAAAFETSLMLALEPALVDLSELDPDPAVPPTGVLGDDPRVHASKEFGEKILARLEEIVREWLSEIG